MGFLDWLVPDKKSRLKVTLGCLTMNFAIIIFVIAIGDADHASGVGTALALLNAPLYVYIFGDTVRPSLPEVNTNDNDTNRNIKKIHNENNVDR
jgi:hypothetical protein